MRLATLQFELKLQKCIRMGITIFKSLIWGGVSLDIRSEIFFLFYPLTLNIICLVEKKYIFFEVLSAFLRMTLLKVIVLSRILGK